MKGFILYQTYEIVEGKPSIMLFGKLENSQSFLTINSYRPYFYIKESDKAALPKEFDYEKSNFKNFNKKLLIKVYTEIPSEIPTLRKYLEDKGVECYEADIKFTQRFLIDNKIKVSVDLNDNYEMNEFVDRIYREPALKPSENYTPKLKVFSIDIETSTDGEKLYSLSIYSKDFEKKLIVYNKKITGALNFSSEVELLEEFQKIILDEDPDILTGWSVIDFDLAFLENKFKENKIPFKLGRNDKTCKIKLESNFFKTSKCDFNGRVVLDAIDMIKGSFINLENYKLSTAAHHFLKEKKLIDDYNKHEEIEKFYKNDPKKLLDYNLKDAKLVIDIIDKSRVLDLTIHRSNLTGMTLDRVNASIASFDSLYLRKLKDKGYAAPSSVFRNKETKIKGGYVMESKPGIYENIIILDFKSLYPSIMRTFNIDPLAFAGKKKGDYIITPNKAAFKRDEALLPEIIESLMKEREKVKKNKDELTSYAIKILLNSMFGVMANPSFRFFNIDMANAITYSGQFLIKLTAEKIEEKGYEVIYSDSVTSNTEIVIKDKENKVQFLKIKDLFGKVHKINQIGKEYHFPKNLSVLTLDKKGKSTFKPIEHIIRHKVNKKVYKVWFTNMESIEVTEDHSLIGYINANFEPHLKTLDRLVEVKPKELGGKIKSIINLKRIPRSTISSRNYPPELYIFMGYFIGDGSFRRNKSHQKSNKDYYLGLSAGTDYKTVIEKIIKPLIRLGYIKNYWLSKTRKGDLIINGLKLIKIITESFRNENGEKTIPDWILYEKEENICYFLNGLFSADGTVMLRDKKPIVRLTNTSNTLIETSKKLLYLIGISNSLFKETKPNKYLGKVSKTTSKHLVIKDIISFKKKIGFVLKRKQERLNSIKSHKRKVNYYNLEFDLSKVKKIQEIRYDDYVYDIEVPEVHRFFANNFLVHNTDSVFIKSKLDDYREAEILGEKLAKEINSFFDKFIKNTYRTQNHLELEFEKVFKMFLMPKVRGSEAGAKKRYAGLRIIDGKEKLEFTGMESRRRDWTDLAKKFQYELLDRIFHKKEVSNFIRDFVKDLKKGKYDDLLIYRKGIRKDIKSYQVQSQHLKAALKLDKIESNIIEYYMTTDGPEPIQNQKHKIDYEYYINKQLKPIADSILLFFDKTFDGLIKGGEQSTLLKFNKNQ